MEKRNELSGIANAHIPEYATIIIRIGLTILADTAASPKISAPIIPNCCSKRRRSSDTCFLY